MRTTLGDVRSPMNLRFSFVAKAAVMAPIMAPTGSANLVNVTNIRHTDSARLVKFNPTLAAVVAAMITCFFVVGFATGHFKRCGNRTADADDNDVIIPRQSRGRPTSQAAKPPQGLDPEIVEALSLIQFKDLLADKKVNSCQDCSVCLAPFDPDDHLRLLPECSHMFHSDCVDVWFQSNSTCPLCRACLAHPVEKESRQDRGRSFSEAGEPIGFRAPEDVDVVVVVISRD